VLAFNAACEEEDRDIAAADQEQRRHGAEKEIEGGAEFDFPCVDHTNEADAEFFGEVGGALLREMFDERLQLGVGLGQCDILAQAERDGEAGIGILRYFRWTKNIAGRPRETRRHDADDLIEHAVEADGAAEDVRIAEKIALPELIAENDDGGGFLSGRTVGWDEPATHHRRDAEMIGVVGLDQKAANIFGKVAVGGGWICALERDDAFEGFESTELSDLRPGVSGLALGALRLDQTNDCEAICVAVRVRVDEDGVDDREDGGGGADAEGEREDGGGGEGGAFAEFAEGVAEVGEDVHLSLASWVDGWKCWGGEGLFAMGMFGERRSKPVSPGGQHPPNTRKVRHPRRKRPQGLSRRLV